MFEFDPTQYKIDFDNNIKSDDYFALHIKSQMLVAVDTLKLTVFHESNNIEENLQIKSWVLRNFKRVIPV